MGKRNARVQEEQQTQAYEQGQQQAAAPAPSPPAAPVDPTVEKINQLAQLHASGALTDEEFAAAKAQALGI
jgi:Short C-terminal domain